MLPQPRGGSAPCCNRPACRLRSGRIRWCGTRLGQEHELQRGGERHQPTVPSLLPADELFRTDLTGRHRACSKRPKRSAVAAHKQFPAQHGVKPTGRASRLDHTNRTKRPECLALSKNSIRPLIVRRMGGANRDAVAAAHNFNLSGAEQLADLAVANERLRRSRSDQSDGQRGDDRFLHVVILARPARQRPLENPRQSAT